VNSAPLMKEKGFVSECAFTVLGKRSHEEM